MRQALIPALIYGLLGTAWVSWRSHSLDVSIFVLLYFLCLLNLYALHQAIAFFFKYSINNQTYFLRRFVFLSAIKLSAFVLLLSCIHWAIPRATAWVIVLGCGTYIWTPFAYALGIRGKDLGG